MRTIAAKLLVAAALLASCGACSKPEPPDKEQPVEPQAAEADTEG